MGTCGVTWDEEPRQLCVPLASGKAWIKNIRGCGQRHLEWHDFRFLIAFVASLDVKTAFDVAKPLAVSHFFFNRHGDTRTRCSSSFGGDEGRKWVPHASKLARRSFAVQYVFDREGWMLQCCGEELPSTYCGKPNGTERPRDGGSCLE